MQQAGRSFLLEETYDINESGTEISLADRRHEDTLIHITYIHTLTIPPYKYIQETRENIPKLSDGE